MAAPNERLLHHRLGAVVGDRGVDFRVWSPGTRRMELLLESGSARTIALDAGEDGYFHRRLDDVAAGTRYRYLLDGRGPFPDPASRHQPEGVHGPSAVVDPRGFAWTDQAWPGIELTDVVLYELHVGTFTPAGTFAGARERLPALRELGVTAIELMPVADFPGERNWGYDGVSLFAPARCYGDPEDLRALVDAAHGLGLAVVQDVVYNHLGPDGNYLGAFSPYYFTDRHQTPWGQAVNLDGPHNGPVRAFLVGNALHWLHEYHFDGLRLDATHALHDDSARHLLAEIADEAHALPGPRRLIIAEDERNLAALVRRTDKGGLGLDAVWADDFHHQIRRRLAGDSDGYFADFSGSSDDIAETMARGFFYRGQMVARLCRPRGSDTAGIAPERFVFCIQNHDQVGNRALGDRLHHQIEPAGYRAALALLLLAPETPLLFMGQEWAASTPFLYFTDHNPELGKLVTEGRREEFKGFAAFSSPEGRERIPDPQAASTFARSHLRWQEREREPHASVLRLARALLRLRGSMVARGQRDAQADAADPSTVVLRYPDCMIVTRLEGTGRTDLSRWAGSRTWTVALDTEDPAFAPDSQPARVDGRDQRLAVDFRRSGAVVLQALPLGPNP